MQFSVYVAVASCYLQRSRALREKALKPPENRGSVFCREQAVPSRPMAIQEDHLKEDIFSDSYLDAFYKAHVAARSGRGNLDEDIAAIEAEIRK